MTAPTSLLLTGAEGFVGRRLAAALATRWPLARRSAAVFDTRSPVAEWDNIAIDIQNAGRMDEVVRHARPDMVIHLAAQASAAKAATAAKATWGVNFLGSFNLAMSVAKHSPGACLLFVSSAEVYGASLRRGPAVEDTPLAPLNVYARTKAAAEAMFGDVLGPPTGLIICRPFNHTGPGQDERFVIPAFAAQLARIEAKLQEPVISVGDLSAKIDFLDVRDVVGAYMRLIDQRETLPSQAVFNIATGRPIEIGEALRRLLALAKRPVQVRVDRSRLRPIDAPQASGDASKLNQSTGWTPVHAFDETLVAVLDYFRQTVGEEKESP